MASISTNITNQNSAIGISTTGNYNNINVRDINVNVNNQNPVIPDFKVPRCIESFHGREDKIKELDILFFKEKKNRIVIHGLPGFGKTEMSKQFAKYCERKRKVKHTFWIEAENEEKLQQSCQQLHKNYEKYKNVPCLYIFDNAVSRSSIFEYEPESEKHLTLITSVDGNWDGVVPVQLDSLPLKEAVRLLKTISNYADELKNESFEELANAVSCVPLGLQIVGGFVREEQMCLRQSFKLEHYVKRINESQSDVLHKNIPASAGNTYKKTVYNAMTVSVDKIRETNDNRAALALNILYICAFTNPDGTNLDYLIRKPTVQELVQFNSSDSDNCRNSSSSSNSIEYVSFRDLTDNSKIQFKQSLGFLINLSFVTYNNNDENYITLHRLTQSFLRDYLESRNLIKKYFTISLHTYLSYCEEYVDIVYYYFKTQNSQAIQIHILKLLVMFGCINCLKKIFKCLTENLIEFAFHCFSISPNNNQFKILEFLFEYININSTNEDGDTVLHIVADTGNTESIKFLIERGLNISAKNNAGDTPLFVLAKSLNDTEDVDWGSILKIFHFNKDLTNNNNETLLHVAAAGVKPTLVEELILNHGMNTNQTDLTNRTPIDSLFSKKNIRFYEYERLNLTFKVLNNHGAKFNIKFANKEVTSEILHSVIKHDDIEFLEYAIQQGCDVHCRNSDNKTLLHSAAEYGNLTIIKLLINKGLNINSVDFYNETAAFKFVRHVIKNNISNMNLVVETLDLLNCQELTQVINTYRNIMLHFAVSFKHKDLVELLIKRYKFNVNQQNDDGNTALHSLIYELDSESNKKNVKHIVKILIQAGADLNIVNENQETPLQMLHRTSKERNFDNSFLVPYLTRRKKCNVM